MDYAISWANELLFVQISGFWNDAVMRRYEIAIADALRTAPSGGFVMLADLRAASPHSPPIADRHVATTAQIGAAGCRAIATVATSALLRRQVDRAQPPDQDTGFRDHRGGARMAVDDPSAAGMI